MKSPHKNILLCTLFLVLVSCEDKTLKETSPENKLLLKLEHWDSKKPDNAHKKKMLGEAYLQAMKSGNDSLKNRLFIEISYRYLQLGDSAKFRQINEDAHKLSLKRKDSNQLALAYWDLALFYYKNNIVDSAYRSIGKAQKIYELQKNDSLSGRTLLDMSIFQKDIRDYTGSEIATIKAISLLKPLEDHWHLYRAYNHLGIIYKELEEYKKSLKYYQAAEKHLDKTKRADRYPALWNNMGVMFKKGGQYEKAAVYFDKALRHKPAALKKEDPELYAMLLDNRAHNRMKSGDTLDLLPQFKKALAIREKENIVPGIIIGKLHLAEYSLLKKDTLSAIQYAKEAKKAAFRIKAYRDMLAALLLLSKIDKANPLAHAQEYIQTNDSLQKGERAVRNKFARIRYETAEYIAKNEKLNNRLFWILMISFCALTLLGLIIAFIYQRSKNKELQLVLEQQKKFEEGRENEKRRIAKELHDGVLNKLFGTRWNLSLLNKKNDGESKQKRKGLIVELQNIESEIRTLSHELSESQSKIEDFGQAIKDFLAKQNFGETRFSFKIEPNVDFGPLGEETKMNLFRIVQEAVQNIHKHAKATTAVVDFRQGKNRLELGIEDNGIGLASTKKDGIGLKNMKSRAKEINGKLKIGKAEKQGTRITINVPIKNEKERK